MAEPANAARSSEIPRAWTIVLLVAAALLLAPFAGWIILALWLAVFTRSWHRRLTKRLRGHDHLAALVTVLALVLVLVPVGVVIALLAIDSVGLVKQLMESDRLHSLLVSLASDKNPNPDASVGELLLAQGGRAWGIVQVIFASAAQIIVGLVVVFAGVYAMLVEGPRWYAWAEQHVPLGPRAWRRFSAAFVETGRGLMFGIAAAGALQALAATGAFLVLGVPQALPLGLLTLVFSIVPVVGTAIVWVPVAVGLAMTGRLYAGIGLGIYGVLVIGSIDNLARPWLTRFGKLQLPGFLVLVSMFGAVEVCGGWGILYGPLVVRLAKEALEVRRETVQA